MTLSQYIRRFCSLHGITYKKFTNDTGYRLAYPPEKPVQVNLNNFFILAEYMSAVGKMPETFYLKRLKSVLKGEYKCRN